MIFVYILIICIIVQLFIVPYTNNLLALLLRYKLSTTYNKICTSYPIIKYDKPIYLFYHICTANNMTRWQDIVDEQMQVIINSGLYDKCTGILYGCNAHDCDIELANYFKQYDKVQPIKSALVPDELVYENVTINSMLTFAKSLDDEAYIVYIHTKGSTNKTTAQQAWRKYMMYWMIDQYNLCIDLLNRDFYTVGTLYSSNKFTMTHYYSGNFFWTTSKYLNSLNLIKDLSYRMHAESFILSKSIKNKHINLTNEGYISYFSTWFRTGLYKYNIPIKVPKNNNDIIITII